MSNIKNRIAIRQNLLNQIELLQKNRQVLQGAPVTDIEISQKQAQQIEFLTLELETLTPFPQPLNYAKELLDGSWLLEYSNAREIRSLSNLPVGFLVGKIYQEIDVAAASFENKAWVEHKSRLLSGYVRITAIFEPAVKDDAQLSNQKINVDFQQRFIGITKLFGLQTQLFDPIKVFKANNPEGRVPSLKTTYIDDVMRIGRGGDDSLFILTRV